MARLTNAQWAEVRAAYEVKNVSTRELAGDFGVSETAIRKKALAECWVKGGSSHLVDANLQIIKDISSVSSQSSQLSSQHLDVISDEVSFRLQSDKDMQAIQKVVNSMAAKIENPVHALALMNATVKHREARLGKSPDTAIQINNSIGVGGKKLQDMTDEELNVAFSQG